MLIPVICVFCVSCDSNADNSSGNANNPNGNTNNYYNENNQIQLSDNDITENVNRKLMNDNSLSSNARMISVTTNNGVVTLSGTVASQEESRKVFRMVKDVRGVRSVNNQLTISNPNTPY